MPNMSHDFYAATQEEAVEAFAWLAVEPTSSPPPPPTNMTEYAAFEEWLAEQPLVKPDLDSHPRMESLSGFDFEFATPDLMQALERCFGVAQSAPSSRVILRSYAGHLLDEVSPQLCARLALLSQDQIEAGIRPGWASAYDGELSLDDAIDFGKSLRGLCVEAMASGRRVFQFIMPT